MSYLAVGIVVVIDFSPCFRELLPKRIGLNHPEVKAAAHEGCFYHYRSYY
jgi:hypothetical protein